MGQGRHTLRSINDPVYPLGLHKEGSSICRTYAVMCSIHVHVHTSSGDMFSIDLTPAR